jgi:predicted transcriptional regulator of viral defense system
MITDDKRVSEVLDDFQRRGLYGFERSRLEPSLTTSPASIDRALNRLAAKGRVKRIRRDFHVILPVEFSAQGMIPYDWYLSDLMRSLGTPYYIGLQSAAALYGAAHQQVQQLQIVTPLQERHIDRPGLSIRFFRKQNFDATTLRSHKGHSGMLPVSTPEATAIDLVRYSRQIGGPDAVLTILGELAETIRPSDLVSASDSETESAHLQRLGWLLDRMDHPDLADPLHASLARRPNLSRTRLDPAEGWQGSSRNRWKVVENADPQSDL